MIKNVAIQSPICRHYTFTVTGPNIPKMDSDRRRNKEKKNNGNQIGGSIYCIIEKNRDKIGVPLLNSLDSRRIRCRCGDASVSLMKHASGSFGRLIERVMRLTLPKKLARKLAGENSWRTRKNGERERDRDWQANLANFSGSTKCV